MADCKEKIRKLLALAESPNENEAKAALLKARQLMAEHKLTEAELRDIENKKVVSELTDIDCTKRRNPWIVSLSLIIGENYCCRAYTSHMKGKQTNIVGFIGFEDDVAFCTQVFEYAVDCVLSKFKQIKKEHSGLGAEYIRCKCDSFGKGFTFGLKAAFKEQTKEKEQEWGLVLVIPKEVNDFVDKKYGKPKQFFSREQLSCYAKITSADEFAKGYKCGKEFNMSRRLESV